MAIPVNYDKKVGCKLISSSCVLWQGKIFDCIEVCKGDTVEDIINKLGDKLCNLEKSLEPINFNLSCFNFGDCPPPTFHDLFQYVLNQLCLLMNNTPGNSEPASFNIMVPLVECLRFENNLGQTVNEIVLYSSDHNDYLTLIGNKICDLLENFDIVETQIVNLQTQITNLTNTIISQQVTLLPLTLNNLFSHITDPYVSSQYQQCLHQIMAYLLALNNVYDGYNLQPPLNPNNVFSQSAFNTLYNEFSSVQHSKKVCSNQSLSLSTDKNIVKAISNLWEYIKDIRDFINTKCSLDECLYCRAVSDIVFQASFTSLNNISITAIMPGSTNFSGRLTVFDNSGNIINTEDYSNVQSILETYTASNITDIAYVHLSGCLNVTAGIHTIPCKFSYSIEVNNTYTRCRHLILSNIVLSNTSFF